MRRGEATYFADENALGLAKILARQGRMDVVHPGHPLLPEVPLGCPDETWMHVVADLDLIVLTRDRRIRTRPAELAIYREVGLRSVWLGGRHDLKPSELADLFIAHEERLIREATKRGPGPWALALTPSGLRPIPMPDP